MAGPFVLLEPEQRSSAEGQASASIPPPVSHAPPLAGEIQQPDSDAETTEVDNLLAHIQRVLAGYSDDSPDAPADTNGAPVGESLF